MAWQKGKLLWIRTGREEGGTVFVLRKSLGTAVARNRLRRRLRHICREMPGERGSLVVFAQPASVNSSFAQLRDELTALLSGRTAVRSR